jgi:hypothetical protein
MFLALPSNRPAVPGALVPADAVAPAPAGITASLRDLADPGAHVLDPQTWGSWFEYALPQLEMAVDSRIEMFRPDVWQTYESIVSGQDGWERQMAEWGVTHVVVQADATAFRDRLVRAGWEVAYEDADGALLIRR